jgi:hypothetical protein
MKKFLIFILILPLFIFGMVWDDEVNKEKSSQEKLLFDISEYIVNNKDELRKQGYKVTTICWTSFNRIHPSYTASYPVKLKKGYTYVSFTQTTGQQVKACWIKDSNDSYSEIKKGTKFSYYYTPLQSGNYHYLVKSTGAYEGIHVSYIIRITK